MADKTVYSQQEILKKLRPLLESEGVKYYKKRNVLAKQAHGGERVTTITGDGAETTNVAKEGDYIVENQTEARERYVVRSSVFFEKYELIGGSEHDGFLEYRPIGKIVALQLTTERLQKLDLPPVFHFEASWGEPMIAKTGDLMCSPLDFSRIYRIASGEFSETYAPL